MKGSWWALIALLLLAGVALRSSFLFLVTVLLALIGAVVVIWSRYCLAGVSYRRRLGAVRLFHGEETELDVDIINAKPLPLPWLRVEDEMRAGVSIQPARLHSSHLPERLIMTHLLSMRWYERVTRRYKLQGTRRGAFRFGPAEIAADDIFGFTTRRADVPDTQWLVVYPRMAPLTELGLPAQHPFGDFKTPERLSEDPLRQVGARPYAPGDSYRHIHWKATAHRQELQTRVFEPSATRPLAIFLNVNTYTHVWEGLDRPTQELAITTAASVARYGWEHGYQIGLYANSVVQPGGDRIRLRPGSHPDQFMWVLDALAKVVEYGRWPLEAILHVEAHRLAYGSTIVVVTPLVTDALLRTMSELRSRHHAVTLLTIGAERLTSVPPGIVYYNIDTREVANDLAALPLA